MAQLSEDSFAAAQGLLTVADVARLLFERVSAVSEVERVALADADGRVLAQTLIAPLDIPAFANSAVDGYAVRSSDLAGSGETVLPVVGRVAAGHLPPDAETGGCAVRIFTGAPLPAGCDTIFMEEDCRVEADGRVALPWGLAAGANARPRGEDVTRGSAALEAGLRLTPESVALAAALGVPSLTVRRPLRVAVFSTGDEIVDPGSSLRPAGVYDANRFPLLALIKRLGAPITDLGILPDDEAAIRQALRGAASSHDLVVTSGGVSIGEADHVKAALSETGTLVFWRVAIKPGRSVALGVVDGTPFVGLPGNPVAVFTTFMAVLRPLLAALAGESWTRPLPIPVPAGFFHRKKKGRREYVRVHLLPDEAHQLRAHKFSVEGAGVLTSLTETDGLVELNEDTVSVEPGDSVAFIAYSALR